MYESVPVQYAEKPCHLVGQTTLYVRQDTLAPSKADVSIFNKYSSICALKTYSRCNLGWHCSTVVKARFQARTHCANLVRPGGFPSAAMCNLRNLCYPKVLLQMRAR